MVNYLTVKICYSPLKFQTINRHGLKARAFILVIYSKTEEQLTVHWATVNCLPLDFIFFTKKP
ncbi:hypothetical protein D8674_004620 [Pyrus ussuriensis x Pyrus communis]|uniref:Uncharacterized protein n=1 Tax=Pyrus ussuriensis x Pyrus communis TaxID=2448454 RepID=A0A5N5FKD8_9ROSA|nr:hypothetical protein D8674_004620 [Pyrus ussuriensis x Pyrus communis]